MSIDEQLINIENEVFKVTNQKLDVYSLAVIRANLMANLPLIDSNKELSEKMNKSISTDHFDNISPTSAFIVKWGWSVPLFVFAGMAIVLCSMYLKHPLRKFEPLENIVLYDSTKSQYFISSDYYTIVKDKDQKGVILKLKDVK